jgi:hypothetical protein
MTKNVKKGSSIALVVLSIFLFFSCDTTLNESIDGDGTVYIPRYIGENLFSITRSGVDFVGTQTGTNQVTLNMANNLATATVTFTVNIYTFPGILQNSVPKTYTLYPYVSQGESFTCLPGGGIALVNITATR